MLKNIYINKKIIQVLVPMRNNECQKQNRRKRPIEKSLGNNIANKFLYMYNMVTIINNVVLYT